MILADNKLQVAKYRLAFIVTFPLGFLLSFYGLFSNSSGSEYLTSIILGICSLIAFMVMLAIKPEYVYVSIVKNNKIVLRNYSAFPLFRKYKAFEITTNNFHDFEVKSKFGGIIKSFNITISKNGKIGKYPPISFSALSKKEINQIIESLNKLVSSEKRKKLL